MTLQDVESALDESGTRFFCVFYTANDTTKVKIRKKEARELLDLYGSTEAGEIEWTRSGKNVVLDENTRGGAVSSAFGKLVG